MVATHRRGGSVCAETIGLLCPEYTVINSGVPNENTRHLLRRVQVDLQTHQPDLVILMIGANDTIESTDLVPLEEYGGNLSRLVNIIQEVGSAVILLTLPLCYEPYLYTRHSPDSYGELSPNTRIRAANQLIHQLAAEMACPVVDIGYYFDKVGRVGETELSLVMNPMNSGDTDGVHPTAEGYRLIASLIHHYMQSKSLRFAKIMCLGDSITFGARVPGEGTTEGLSYPAQLQALLN